MGRIVAIVAFASAAALLPVSAMAQDAGDPERAFARAARSFTACLASEAEGGSRVAPDSDTVRTEKPCVIQEGAYRAANIRLRISRGQTPEQAATDTDEDVREGRRLVLEGQVSRYAMAR
ncbi:hypothetical protein ACWPMX_12095 [Tsuneonella sp. HG094]